MRSARTSVSGWQVARVAAGVVAVCLLAPLPAAADVVADWSKIALHTIVSSEQRPAQAAVKMAAVHVAMFETMNFIEGIYVPRFVVKPHRALQVSSEAAAAAAAHHVLVQLHPEHEGALAAALVHSTAAISEEQVKQSALITGKAIGGNIYAIWSSDLDSAAKRVSAPKASPGRVSTHGTGANHVAWYWIVGQFVEARGLSPIESARIYALVSLALTDVYRKAGDTKEAFSSECVPCAAGAAIQVILESEPESAGGSTMMSGPRGTGAAYTSSRVREYAKGVSFAPNPGAGNGESLGFGEEAGRRIGMQTLMNYPLDPALKR